MLTPRSHVNQIRISVSSKPQITQARTQQSAYTSMLLGSPTFIQGQVLAGPSHLLQCTRKEGTVVRERHICKNNGKP